MSYLIDNISKDMQEHISNIDKFNKDIMNNINDFNNQLIKIIDDTITQSPITASISNNKKKRYRKNSISGGAIYNPYNE